MKNGSFYFFQAGMVYFLSISSVIAASVSGHVETPSQVKELIVFLQPESASIRNKSTETHEVSQKDTEFHPPLTIITAGDKVQWSNDESKEIDHNIFSLSPIKKFDLGLGENGSKLSQLFDKTGVLGYYCSVHKNMEGKIIILPTRNYQLLDSKRDFLIENVPEGRWTLSAIVLHLRYKAEPLALTLDKNSVNNLTLKVVKK